MRAVTATLRAAAKVLGEFGPGVNAELRVDLAEVVLDGLRLRNSPDYRTVDADGAARAARLLADLL